ncbi:uncharacterized protein ACBR49_013285 isoform 1-T1 [Aulostomus maculatus]
MPSMQVLRACVSQRMAAAVEEIMGMFESAIGEYEAEMSRRWLLGDAALPDTEIDPRRGASQHIEPLLVRVTIPLKHQDGSPSLDQEDPEPPLIKVEQEEVWTSQKREDCPEPESQFPPSSVKTEDEEEERQLPQIQKRATENPGGADPPACSSGEQMDCGGSEAASDMDGAASSKADSSYQVSLSLCSKTDDRNHMTDSQPFSDSGKNGNQRSHRYKKLYKCSVCKKMFQQKQDLLKHTVCHIGEKPFDCVECSRKFNRRESLCRHMRTHTGEKPFTCLICGKSFAWNLSLASHMRTHTGEKPFCCSVCQKCYNDRANLQRHMRTHTGEKPFHCLVCGKNFRQSSTLVAHMRTHTGEKPFSCSLCERSFNDRANLRRHVRLHAEKSFI